MDLHEDSIDMTDVATTEELTMDPIPPPDLQRNDKKQVDLRNLDYVTDVNENLICAVCRVALVAPITTACDHVFCEDCLRESFRFSPVCPIDRIPLNLQELRPTPKIIINQLDGLMVKCPNLAAGCCTTVARSMVQDHVSKYCEFTMVECAADHCSLDVPRKYAEDFCRHVEILCPDCYVEVWDLELDHHRAEECEERMAWCEECGQESLRMNALAHERDCEEGRAQCKWAAYGCTFVTKKKHISSHASSCELRIMGPVIENMKQEITHLRGETQYLNEQDKIKDRRIRFLECKSSASTEPTPLDMSTLPDVSPSPEYGPYESRDQYLLSLLEHQEDKVNQLQACMTELDSKLTMMLVNETIPIKENLSELRNVYGTLSMHVRWLLQFRRQESRPSAGGNNGSPGGNSGGRMGMAPMGNMGNLNNSTRDNETKL